MKIFFWLLFFSPSLYAFLPSSFSASYEEVHISVISGKEKRTEGLWEYRYPAQIRLVSQKKGTIFVSSGKVSWYYTAPMFEGEPGYCTIKRTPDMGVIGLFDSLNKGLASNKDYEVLTLKNKKKVVFRPHQKKQLGIASAMLKFKTKISFQDLASIEIEYVDGKKVRLDLRKKQLGKKFSKEHFVFVVPKNTKISYQ